MVFVVLCFCVCVFVLYIRGFGLGFGGYFSKGLFLYYSITLLLYTGGILFHVSAALDSSGVLPSNPIISLALHITTQHTNK